MAPGMLRCRPQPSQGAHTPEVRLRELIHERCPVLAGHRCLQTLARGRKRGTETRDGDEAWTPKIVRRIRCSDITGQLLEGLTT